MLKKTPFDKINEGKARALRNLTDAKIKLLGTKIDLIRVRLTSDDAFAGRNSDVFGFSAPRYKTDIISNCILVYPFPEVELFDNLTDAGNLQVKAFDMNEFLPIKLYLPHKGDFENTPDAIIKGDILIDVKHDGWGNKIPVLLQATVGRGTMAGKELARRYLELSLLRALPDRELLQVINTYLANT